MKIFNIIITTKENQRTRELEAISKLETTTKELEKAERLYARAKLWLNEIVSNHRFTPVSTAEIAIKELEELEK